MIRFPLSNKVGPSKWHFYLLYRVPLFQNESVQNLSNENEFDLHENEHVGGIHFYTNSLKRRLALTQRQKATRK